MNSFLFLPSSVLARLPVAPAPQCPKPNVPYCCRPPLSIFPHKRTTTLLHFSCPPIVTTPLLKALAKLQSTPNLQSLSLDLGESSLRAGAQAFATVPATRTLTSLQLVLTANSLPSSVHPSLAELPLLHPHLHTLTLGLDYNRLGAATVQAIAVALQGHRTLETLTLSLRNNPLGPAGPHALVQLRELPRLRVLSLALGDTDVGDEGAEVLGQLKTATGLVDLTLDLSFNGVGDRGAQALGALGEAPKLQCLCLDLSYNNIGERGALVLHGLGRTVRCIVLDLGAKLRDRVEDMHLLYD